MLDWILVLVVALGASFLTLFSGFGLGTLLLPAFAIVFPLDVAVAATAVVHLSNNAWKGAMLYRSADWRVVARFGMPAVVAAFAGASVLLLLRPTPIATYRLAGLGAEVTSLGLVVGTMIALFALFDLIPRLKSWQVSPRHLPLGGLLSGFFGGLSGHQGALRSVFLTKVGLDAKTFVATGTFSAILVDVARTAVYGFGSGNLAGVSWALVGLAIVSAFAGATIGRLLLGKLTMDGVRTLVGVMLLLVGSALAAGLL